MTVRAGRPGMVSIAVAGQRCIRLPAAGELVRPQVVARAAPRADAAAVAVVNEFRPDFRKHIVHAREARRDAVGRLWYRIMLVGRPNGRMGRNPFLGVFALELSA